MDNLTRLFNSQVDRAWDLFVVQKKFEDAFALSQRLLLEPRMSDTNQACLHLILAHTHDQAVEHARLSLELYQAVYDQIDPAKVEGREAAQQAIEVAQEVLDNAIKREEESDVVEETGDEGDEESEDASEEGDCSDDETTGGEGDNASGMAE